MTDYEESISGFKLEGDWCDIVEHGERLAFALEEVNADDELLDEYNDWRPKVSENINEDVNKKTAEQAMMSENKREKEADKPQEDMQVAGEKIVESYLELNEPDEAFRQWVESLGYAARAFETTTRKSIRRMEKVVYENVMTLLAPYYFDNELVSANLNRVGRNPNKYVLEVNVNDDKLKTEVSGKLEEYEDKHERWHVSTKKDIQAVAAVEGVEGVEEDNNDEKNPHPMCN